MKRTYRVTTVGGGLHTYGPDWDNSFMESGVWFFKESVRVFHPYATVVVLSEQKH